MEDEVTTDVTNSADATQTGASATTEPSSSATQTTQTDGLDGTSTLGDATVAAAEGSDTVAAAEGDDTVAAAEGDDTVKAGEGDEALDPATLRGAPEGDYTIEGLPEGMALDPDALAAAAPIFKTLDLSDKGASELAKVYAEKVLPGVVEKAQRAATEGLITDIVATRAAWDSATTIAISGGKVPVVDEAGEPVMKDGKPEMTDAKADPIYAGKSKDEVLAVAARALDRFGTPALREQMKATGWGNHPDMVRFAFQAGSLISEDTDFVRTGDTPNTPKSREEKYYGKS